MSHTLRSWASRQFPLVLPLVLLLLAWPWAFFGLLRFARWPLAARVLAACCWLTITMWLFFSTPSWWGKAGVFVASVLIVRLVSFSHPPKQQGNWVEEQSKLSTAEFDGDLVTVRNFRHTVYRSIDDCDVRFLDRTFDLATLETVDFIIVPFASWRGIAHVFVTFGFAGGDYLAVSVEARREQGEAYSPIGGLFGSYEVIYVFGDERDLLGKRAVFEKHPVHLYPLIADAASARGLLLSMFAKANELAERPQFYHTVTNTCTSNVLDHAAWAGRPRRYDFRLVFPGFSDGLAVEYGLVEAPDGLQAVREKSLINLRAERAPMDDGRAWSRALRRPPSP